MNESNNAVHMGDEFRCKRRGHIIKVLAVVKVENAGTVEKHEALFTNARGARRTISISRLLTPSRFERIVVHAAVPCQAEESVA